MNVNTDAETVKVEYESTRGNNSRVAGEVEEIHTKEAMFGDGETVQAIDLVDKTGEVYRLQHTGTVRHQNQNGFRTVGYSGEVIN